jgi:hypothetical protein
MDAAFALFGDDDDEAPSKAAVSPQISPHEEMVTIRSYLDSRAISRAASCLREHGLVILPKLFENKTVIELGSVAVRDFDLAMKKIDKGSTKADFCFAELSARQEGRYEMRNGPELSDALKESPIQGHPGIMAILRDACAAPGHALKEVPVVMPIIMSRLRPIANVGNSRGLDRCSGRGGVYIRSRGPRTKVEPQFIILAFP